MWVRLCCIYGLVKDCSLARNHQCIRYLGQGQSINSGTCQTEKNVFVCTDTQYFCHYIFCKIPNQTSMGLDWWWHQSSCNECCVVGATPTSHPQEHQFTSGSGVMTTYSASRGAFQYKNVTLLVGIHVIDASPCGQLSANRGTPVETPLTPTALSDHLNFIMSIPLSGKTVFFYWFKLHVFVNTRTACRIFYLKNILFPFTPFTDSHNQYLQILFVQLMTALVLYSCCGPI